MTLLVKNHFLLLKPAELFGHKMAAGDRSLQENQLTDDIHVLSTLSLLSTPTPYLYPSVCLDICRQTTASSSNYIWH